MASRYDATAQCRVGRMDETQFYAEADEQTGDFFRSLVRSWRSSGGTLQWGAGGVGLRGVVDGKVVGLCFLAPAYAGKKDRIELSCSSLTRSLGATAVEQLLAALKKAAGTQYRGTSMISIVDPGRLAPASREHLAATICGILRPYRGPAVG